jgi:hypothetical protein
MAAKIHHAVARYSLHRLVTCHVSVAALRAPCAVSSRRITHKHLQELAA